MGTLDHIQLEHRTTDAACLGTRRSYKIQSLTVSSLLPASRPTVKAPRHSIKGTLDAHMCCLEFVSRQDGIFVCYEWVHRASIVLFGAFHVEGSGGHHCLVGNGMEIR